MGVFRNVLHHTVYREVIVFIDPKYLSHSFFHAAEVFEGHSPGKNKAHGFM